MSPGSQLLYEDDHCLAVVKRAGQFVQGAWAPAGEKTLEQEVRSHLRADDPASAYVGIVHRLDRPVSGVLLWAKTTKAARRLSLQFERRQVEKEYWAIVEAAGALQAEEGCWDDWLTRPDQQGVVSVVEPGTQGCRLARTRFVLGRAECIPEGTLWIRLFPETGRTHQLRIQCARRGWPVLGDTTYGARKEFSPGIALHARRLRARHPVSQSSLDLRAAPPESWGEHGITISWSDP